MAIYLTEADVERLLDMPTAIEAVEEGFRLLGEGTAQNQPRRRVSAGESILHFMAGGSSDLGSVGRGTTAVKVYTSSRSGVRFTVMLYDDDGTPLSLMQANRLGQMRTGAASGVATRYLAREDSRLAGIIGTGWQARGQLMAVKEARPIERVRAFGRDEERRLSFCKEMEEALGVPVEPVDSAEASVKDADIVITATRAKDPVLPAEWLKPGMHVNAVGSNWHNRREMNTEAVLACHRVTVDTLEVAQLEAGDLILPVAEGSFSWDKVEELGEIVAGKRPGRESDDQITLFCSQGLALEDVVVGRRIYERAKAEGVGMPFEP
jgi:ornithine cyclodeaminase/alanine dehydrogenase-like protein (mu-crystallin family)